MAKEKKTDGAETIRMLIKAGKYEFSIHAEKERQADKITMVELEEALSSCKVIEDYPTDPRGASCLVLGFAAGRASTRGLGNEARSRGSIAYHGL